MLEDNLKALVKTATDELLIPVRLYYIIHNKKQFIKSLKKLKCVQFADSYANRFVILYHKEAKNINLETHYQDVPEELYPIRIADCHIVNDKLYVDLKSLRRAVEIIHFLITHIKPYNLIEITDFAHSNVLTMLNEEEIENFNIAYDKLFDALESDALLNKIEGKDRAKPLTPESIKDLIYEEEKNNYPSAEKFSIKYNRATHENLINGLVLRTAIKERVAMERHGGKNKYTSLDAAKDLVEFASSNVSTKL